MIAGGCAAPPPHPVVVSKTLPSPVVSQAEQTLDPGLLKSALEDDDGQPYRVGPGDTLLVAVYNHPELAVATYGGGAGLAANGTAARAAGLSGLLHRRRRSSSCRCAIGTRSGSPERAPTSCARFWRRSWRSSSKSRR